MTRNKADARHSKAQRRAARKAEARKRAQRQQMLRWGGIAVVVTVVLVGTFIFMNRGDDPPEAVAYDEITSDGRYLGNPDASIEFVVYSDFQCPFCEQFDTHDFPPLVENFVETGDVRVEWRPMPVIASSQNIPMDSPENESVRSAEAAMCAADQGQMWPYSDALFDAQGDANSGVFNDEMLIDTADGLEMDTQRFESCLASGEKYDEVMSHYDGALQRGVMGTPTFLINDVPVRYTAEGYADLERRLDDALSQEGDQ